MLSQLPLFIPLLFIATTFLTIYFFIRAAQYSKYAIIIIIAWIAIQAFISFSGFYTITDTMPPRFPFIALPPIVLIAFLFISSTGSAFLDRLDGTFLTLLHIVRIPVELVLFWLFFHKTVPQIMTFEGRNFDILAGISTLPVYYFYFIKKSISPRIVLVWNVICLLLLLNIVTLAVLSIPSRFQHFGFEQPNIAILYFPFVWLPCCIVPIVLLSHLTMIKRLIKSQKDK